MRVKLSIGDYAGVIAEGNKLVPASRSLCKSYRRMDVNCDCLTALSRPLAVQMHQKKIFFRLKMMPQDDISVNGSLPGQFGPANLGGRGLVSVSPIIWNNSSWKCDDKRRTLLYTSGTNNINGTSIMTIKYKDFTNRGDWAPQVRYAEVLLTLAEAEARQAAGCFAKGS